MRQLRSLLAALLLVRGDVCKRRDVGPLHAKVVRGLTHFDLVLLWSDCDALGLTSVPPLVGLLFDFVRAFRVLLDSVDFLRASVHLERAPLLPETGQIGVTLIRPLPIDNRADRG